MAFLVFCVGFFFQEEVSVAFGDITNSREGGLSDVITLAWIGASITIDTIITFLSGIPYLYKNQKGAKKTSVPLSHLQFPWLLLSAASSYHHLPSFSQSTISAGHNCIKWSVIGIVKILSVFLLFFFLSCISIILVRYIASANSPLCNILIPGAAFAKWNLFGG